MSHQVPRGFRLAGVSCGIKRVPGKEDLTLVVCERNAAAAGVYTTNLVYAAPVAVDKERTPSNEIRVVVVNSGNANACTGERGKQDALAMCRLAAESIGSLPEQSLVMSTGIIGEFLPMEKIASGIRAAANQLSDTPDALLAAARGIMTTDNGPKVASRTLTIGNHSIRITAIAKGAAMIGPNMATMLAIVLTDAPLTGEVAQAVLRSSVSKSFNCISVEGHMSTNDTVLLLASGVGPQLAGEQLAQFQAAVDDVCIELAKMIPNDGEGASHLISIQIRGCRDTSAAHTIARSVANSALVKTAIAGGDPNWGRIVSAAGYAGVPFDPAQVNLRLNGTPLYRQGAPVHFDAAAVSQSIRSERETRIELDFGEGSANACFWTSDLTHEYVRMNADYHT